MDDPLIDSLRAAVTALPDNTDLRVHLAAQLAERGRRDEAVREAAAVLQIDPANAQALAIITGQQAPRGVPAPATTDRSAALPPTTGLAPGDLELTDVEPAAADEIERSDAWDQDPGAPAAPQSPESAPAPTPTDDPLRELGRDLAGVLPPRFVDEDPTTRADIDSSPFDVGHSGITLADVGGMADVKARLEASVLAPVRNPELGKLYGKTLRGGLLLYGPPGCGKTFLARAVAGELDARFMSISLSDVLDMYIGVTERNVHEIFETARANAPCVVFFDEVDAIGQKRTQRGGLERGQINQLLAEMDGVAANNDGVFVLGATNHPWDVDTALRRPGRFDRMLLVLPPDEAARDAILRFHMRDRPIAKINVPALARRTDGFSGADLAYLCDLASERALMDSAHTGQVRLIEMRDFEASLSEVRPSIGPWLETARNVAEFANQDGTYDELATYLRRRRR